MALAKKVLLIGWDAADWNFIRPLLAAGQLPNLRKFVDEGVNGDLASIEPMLSPLLWTSIATGKRPHKHGILGFTEPRHDGEGIRAVASTSRQCKAIWNIVSQMGRSAHCVNWYASHPAEPIKSVSVSNRFAIVPPSPGAPWPAMDEIVHPPDAQNVLGNLRVRPEQIDGSMLLPLVPRAAEVDQETDKRLLACAVILAETASTHGAITWCLEQREWNFAAVLYNAIDQFCHLFARYMPPKMDSVSARDAEIYGGVVAAAYRFHDMMLGRLMQLAGDDATIIIVSDHGFRRSERVRESQNLQTLALEHRRQGILLMRGPGIRRGESIEGASLLDITPTILALMGLPIGGDMDGRPLLEAMVSPQTPEAILSWDSREGDAGMHPAELREEPAESLEAVRHLIELGYVERPDEDVQKTLDHTVEENQCNLARSLIDARQPAKAIAVLETLAQKRPGNALYAVTLFEAYYTAGRDVDCRRIAHAMWDRGHRGPLAHLAMGVVDLARRDAHAAMEHFKEAERVNPRHSGLHVLIGRAFLRLQDWESAGHAFAHAIEVNGDNEDALDGLACVALNRDQFETAAEYSLRAVALRNNFAEAHYHLGVALSRLNRPDSATVAFEKAISIRPNLLAAYGRLIDLFEGPLLDQRRAREVRRRADELMLQRRMKRQSQSR